MKSLRILSFFAASLLLAMAAIGSARASLIHDLSISGDLSGLGRITFKTTSGNSISDVAAFSFSGTVNLGGGAQENFTFGLSEIDDIVWSIDENWNLSYGISSVDLNPSAVHGDCIVFGVDIPTTVGCTVSAGGNPVGLFIGADNTAAAYRHLRPFGRTDVRGTPSSAPVHVSEPGTAMLFGVGLFALALLARWSRRAA